ncbi:type II toxin-antitoxin system HicB family antitoxin [Lachnospiraceae bacterium ZAX-1]
MRKSMTLRIPEELHGGLREIAKERGTTMNSLVLQILWGWIRKNKKP